MSLLYVFFAVQPFKDTPQIDFHLFYGDDNNNSPLASTRQHKKI
jgi:hypothetical protein